MRWMMLATQRKSGPGPGRRAACGPVAIAFAALMGLLPAGCVSKPVVTVHHAEVRSASLQGVAVAVILKVNNPNSYDVQVRNVRANVVIAGRYPMGPISISPNQWLPANQSTLVPVPVTVPWQLVPALVAESAGRSAIPYHVTGSADVSAVRSIGLDRDDYPIDEEGTIPREIFLGAARSVMPIF
jgi:LEA14-like dessication related protein